MRLAATATGSVVLRENGRCEADGAEREGEQSETRAEAFHGMSPDSVSKRGECRQVENEGGGMTFTKPCHFFSYS
ncbi:hypothetical protein GCM10011408_04650 [Dyella caseinilytica]|nr:hypothetical protein GCM10011408_04650 [Dyella caseinilytica]